MEQKEKTILSNREYKPGGKRTHKTWSQTNKQTQKGGAGSLAKNDGATLFRFYLFSLFFFLFAAIYIYTYIYVCVCVCALFGAFRPCRTSTCTHTRTDGIKKRRISQSLQKTKKTYKLRRKAKRKEKNITELHSETTRR